MPLSILFYLIEGFNVTVFIHFRVPLQVEVPRIVAHVPKKY